MRNSITTITIWLHRCSTHFCLFQREIDTLYPYRHVTLMEQYFCQTTRNRCRRLVVAP